MTTRPGYVWDAVASEWVEIGQSAVVAPVSYQSSAPSSPATGDIWIDSDDEVPGITSSLNYRWRKIATGGETSLSGNDASGLPLAYNPGYEQVYLNGVLLYRGSDYTATTGNTIIGLTALVANDTIEVLSFVTAPIGDTYTQAAADAKFLTQVNAASTYAIKNNPMFLVCRTTSQTISGAGGTNVIFNTKTYDTNNFYDTSNGRFTPTIAGYYQLSVKTTVGGGGVNRSFPTIHGPVFALRGNDLTVGTGSEIGAVAQGIMYFNGTTDYAYISVYANGSGNILGSGTDLTYFSGSLVRAA
jgi:hypothetical protein